MIVRQRLWFVLLCLLLWPLLAQAATYYVSTSGSNSTSCSAAQNPSSPKRTISTASGGVACLSAGDTLQIRGGTYAEALRTSNTAIPSGTASLPITIQSFPGETATLTGEAPAVIDLSSGSNISYLTFRNLILDSTAWAFSSDHVAFYLGATNHDIRVEGFEVKSDYARSGPISNVGLAFEGGATQITIANTTIHGWRDYGFYIFGTFWTLDTLTIYDTGGYGIQIYKGGANDDSNHTVKNSLIYNTGNNYPVSTCGIILSSGSNNLAYNNIVRNTQGCGIQVAYGCSGCQVLNNTIAGNSGTGLDIFDSASNTGLVNNVMTGNAGGSLADAGLGTSFATNLCATSQPGCAVVGTPTFVNSGAGDYHLAAGSVGLNVGTTLGTVPVDKDGVARPQGTAYDLGAYERVETGAGGGCTSACVVYVAPSGSDSQACNTADSTHPRQTLAGGLACLTQPGSTLYLRAGTYANVAVDTATTFIAGGTSWAAPTTIAGYANETVTLQLASAQSALFWFRSTANDHYIVLDRLILDAQHFLNSDALVVYPGVQHLRFQNGEIKNTYYSAVYLESTTDVQILSSKLHDALNAPVVNVTYSATGTLLEGNDISSSGWSGIVADANDHPAAPLPDVTIRRNVIHGVGTAHSQPALRVGCISNAGLVVTNNVVYGNYAGVQVTTGSAGAQVYQNTVYSNSTVGIQIDAGATTTQVVNNISSDNGGVAILNNGTSTTLGTNLTVTPPFVNAGAGDFHLQASAAGAINVGTTLGTVTTDYDGVSRPQGAAYDIGAFEFVGTPNVPQAVQIRAPYWMSTGRFGR